LLAKGEAPKYEIQIALSVNYFQFCDLCFSGGKQFGLRAFMLYIYNFRAMGDNGWRYEPLLAAIRFLFLFD